MLRQESSRGAGGVGECTGWCQRGAAGSVREASVTQKGWEDMKGFIMQKQVTESQKVRG